MPNPNGLRAQRKIRALERAMKRMKAPNAILSVPEVAALFGRSPEATIVILERLNEELHGMLLRNLSGDPKQPRWGVPAMALRATGALDDADAIKARLEQHDDQIAELRARSVRQERTIAALLEQLTIRAPHLT